MNALCVRKFVNKYSLKLKLKTFTITLRKLEKLRQFSKLLKDVLIPDKEWVTEQIGKIVFIDHVIGFGGKNNYRKINVTITSNDITAVAI